MQQGCTAAAVDLRSIYLRAIVKFLSCCTVHCADQLIELRCLSHSTRSVATGFGQHGMPPPAANDTGTALGQDGPDGSRDLATLTFDLGGHGACG